MNNKEKKNAKKSILNVPTKLSCIMSFSFLEERRLARLTLSANTIFVSYVF